MPRGFALAVTAVAVLVTMALPSNAIADYACHGVELVAVEALGNGAGPVCSFEVTCPASAPNGCDLDISGSATGIGSVGVLIQTAGAAIGTGCFGAVGCAAPHTIGHIHAGDTHSVYGEWSGASGVSPLPAPLATAAVLARIRVDARLTQ